MAVASELIDVSGFANLLAAGQNVLAVQGLNVSADDDDFLLLPELRLPCSSHGSRLKRLCPTQTQISPATTAKRLM